MADALAQELDRMTAALDRLERVLGHGHELDPIVLDAERNAFAAVLADHFTSKELLYERLRARGGHELEPAVRRSRAATLGLVVAYRLHRADWRMRPPTSDPASFTAAAAVLIARARTIIASDRAGLVPAARRLAPALPAA